MISKWSFIKIKMSLGKLKGWNWIFITSVKLPKTDCSPPFYTWLKPSCKRMILTQRGLCPEVIWKFCFWGGVRWRKGTSVATQMEEAFFGQPGGSIRISEAWERSFGSFMPFCFLNSNFDYFRMFHTSSRQRQEGKVVVSRVFRSGENM